MPRHFIPHFENTWDDTHRETGELQTHTDTTPDPELVTCERCRAWMRSKGITKSIAEQRTPIDMDAIPVSPYAGPHAGPHRNWIG